MNQLARRLWVDGGSDFGWCVVGVGVSYLTTVIVAGALCTHEIRPIDKQCKQNSGHKKYTPTYTHTHECERNNSNEEQFSKGQAEKQSSYYQRPRPGQS